MKKKIKNQNLNLKNRQKNLNLKKNFKKFKITKNALITIKNLDFFYLSWNSSLYFTPFLFSNNKIHSSSSERNKKAKYEKKWRNIVSSLDDCIQFNGKEFTQMLLYKSRSVRYGGIKEEEKKWECLNAILNRKRNFFRSRAPYAT